MPSRQKRLVVFVHGWSVTSTETYGELPRRLVVEAAGENIDIAERHVFLGRYVSFRDEVRLEDISRAFRAAIERELAEDLREFPRFVCITHSTGGPVLRDWWQRYYATSSETCPASHLIMLAPANFGSALARLGKSRLSRIRAWFESVEPGTGVLDWLELGSPGAWDLNTRWIESDPARIGPKGIFPFVITGQTIDRKLYDHVVPYTGENGSDGVVRVAAANLNSTYIRLEQEEPKAGTGSTWEAPKLTAVKGSQTKSPKTAMRVVAGCSHSGDSIGIMRSVSGQLGGPKGSETVQAILMCLKVDSSAAYATVCNKFVAATRKVQKDEQVEVITGWLGGKRYIIHDRCSMVIFRLRDDKGHPIEDFDLILTGGDESDPDLLPQGFYVDDQMNTAHPGTVTYYVNYDLMVGCEPVFHGSKKVRGRRQGAGKLGFLVKPQPDEAFVHYLPCGLQATKQTLTTIVKPNQTTLVDIVLRRVVREGVFGLDRGFTEGSFKNVPEGPPIE